MLTLARRASLCLAPERAPLLVRPPGALLNDPGSLPFMGSRRVRSLDEGPVPAGGGVGVWWGVGVGVRVRGVGVRGAGDGVLWGWHSAESGRPDWLWQPGQALGRLEQRRVCAVMC
jgi:hypothetical protein